MARPSWAPLCPDCAAQLRFRFSRVYGPDDREADYFCPGCGATGTRREPHCAWVRWSPTVLVETIGGDLLPEESREVARN